MIYIYIYNIYIYIYIYIRTNVHNPFMHIAYWNLIVSTDIGSILANINFYAINYYNFGSKRKM